MEISIFEVERATVEVQGKPSVKNISGIDYTATIHGFRYKSIDKKIISRVLMSTILKPGGKTVFIEESVNDRIQFIKAVHKDLNEQLQ